MVNVLQYPDILTYEKATGGGSHYDEDGNLVIDPPISETVSLKCRAEANTKGQYLISEDGQKIEFGWVIYMPLPATYIPYGTGVTVHRKAVLRAKGEVKRNVVDQLDAKVWL